MKHAILTVIFCFVLMISALAQTPSLADLPATAKFVSASPAFSVWLPSRPTKIENNDEGGKLYRWELKEGHVVIEHGNFLDAAISPKSGQWFLDGYKQGFTNKTHLRLVAEAPRHNGAYKGIMWTIEIPAEDLTVRDWTMATTRSYFTIIGGADLKVPNSEALMVKVLNSLNFSPVRRPAR